MDCRNAIELLQRRMDGDNIGEPPDLAEHLSACAPCRQQFAAAQVLLTTLKSPSWPVPSGTLTERIVSGVIEDRHVRRAKLHRRLWFTAALAASILVFAGAGYLWLPGMKKQNEGTNIARPNQRVAPESPQKAIGSFAEDWQKKARDNVDKLRKIAPDLGSLSVPGLAKLEEPLEPAARALAQTGREMGEGLQIMAMTTFQAFDYFVRELPATRISN